MIVLTSTCASVGGCHAGSPQEQWLRGVLAANPAPCTVAYWHHPRFSSGSSHDGDGKFQPFWEALYEAGAELVLSGHTHAYERFAPQTPDGGADAQFGLRQLTIGLGGKSRHSFGTIRPNSEFRYNSAYAALKLTLHAAGYEWQTINTAKTVVDAGVGTCHGAPDGAISPVASSSSDTTSTG